MGTSPVCFESRLSYSPLKSQAAVLLSFLRFCSLRPRVVNSHCTLHGMSKKAPPSTRHGRLAQPFPREYHPPDLPFIISVFEQPLVQDCSPLCSELKGAVRISGFSTGPRLVHVPTCMRILRRMNPSSHESRSIWIPRVFRKGSQTLSLPCDLHFFWILWISEPLFLDVPERDTSLRHTSSENRPLFAKIGRTKEKRRSRKEDNRCIFRFELAVFLEVSALLCILDSSIFDCSVRPFPLRQLAGRGRFQNCVV
jgi:hypothetical protein